MSELEAGPALDALVAEKVMGAERLESCGLHYNCKKDSGRYGWQHANGIGNHHLPDYSTDIAAAWLVKAKMDESLFSKRTLFYGLLGEILDKDSIEKVRAAEPSLRVAWPYAIRFLTPLAICRAALKAAER